MRPWQCVLVVSLLAGSWLGMQAVHELGHILGAKISGLKIVSVVLHPLAFSQTDLAVHPRPPLVVWLGPLVGVVAPLTVWAVTAWCQWSGSFVLRFFAGFCAIANGCYLAFGSFLGAGDCGELLAQRVPMWQLWLFGAIVIPLGFWLWHGQAKHFGFGKSAIKVERQVALVMLFTCIALVVVGLAVGK